MNLFIYYILLINLYGFIIMYMDKQKSKKGQWRISEKNLFIVATIYGSIGILLGMYIFRHKTKHMKFTVGIPFIILIQLVILIYSNNIFNSI